MPRYASIDVGTNTVRLLMADEEYLTTQKPLVVEKVITRLGGRFKETGGLHPDSMARTVATLRRFSEIMRSYGVARYRAVATSVVREAPNADEFLSLAGEQAGLTLEVIDCYEEARLTLEGVKLVVNGGRSPLLIFDIGGGSTEYILSNPDGAVRIASLELGVVHLAEVFLKADPPDPAEVARMEDAVVQPIGRCRRDFSAFLPVSDSPLLLAGCGGTVTTLAAIELGLQRYEPERVNNYSLGYRGVTKVYRKFLSQTRAERKEVRAMEPGREDVIIPGCAIVLKTMETFRADQLRVSDAGLLEGNMVQLLSGRVPGC